MKKSIIIPIVAALMSVVVAVSVAVIIQDATDGNIWHKVTVVGKYHDRSFYGGALIEEKTFNVVNSQEELIALYNEYGGNLCSSCNHLIDEQIRSYNDKFFRKKSLIIAESWVYGSELLSLENIYLEKNILNVDIYRVRFSGPVYWYNVSIFIEVKKSEIKEMTDTQLSIVNIMAEEATANRKYHIPKGREMEFPKNEIENQRKGNSNI